MSQTCLLVLGMHRSGTSALSGLLSLAGFTLGSELLAESQDNPKGHFENLNILRFNDRVLKEIGSSWDDIAFDFSRDFEKSYMDQLKAILISEFSYTKNFALKDPRIIFLFDLYRDVMRDLSIDFKILIPYRSPLEVASSLEKRNLFSKEKGLLLWSMNMAMAEIKSRGFPRVFINYDDLINNPADSIYNIDSVLNTELAKLLDLSKVKDFIDPNLNRNSFGNVQFSDRMPSFVQEIYAGLINPDENKKIFYLDNASKALFTYRDFFVSADYRSSILKANELENKLKSKHEVLERFKEKFTSLKYFVEKQNSTIDDIKSKNIILESEYRAQLEQVNERSVNLEREVEKLRGHSASAKVAFTALQYENKKLKSELVSVYTSRSWILTRPLRKLFSLLKKSSAK